MRRLFAAALVLCAIPAHLLAQRPAYSVQFSAFEWETGSNTKMAAYGLLTGAAGFFAGGLVGAVLGNDPDDEDSWVETLEGAVVGGTVGESLMLPVGVHLANDRRGDLSWSMPASLVLGVAGAAVARNLDRSGRAWPVLILTPIAQIVTSIAIERNTDN
ncbi:MAG TPA: hypothetical protein VGD27_18770 [Longimicrobiales bacterium]